MPFTVVGFYESVDQAAAYNALTALADQHVRVNGDDLLVPPLNQIVAVAGGIDSTAAARLRLVSPSLRAVVNLYVAPLNGQAAAAQEPDTPQAVLDLRKHPVSLVVGEQLNADSFADPAAAREQWCIVWLASGAIEEYVGRVHTVRATSATAAVAGAWTNVAIAFDEDLPRGRYAVVGLRPMSAGMVAARCAFVGGGPRPGALGVDLIGDLQHPMFRYGGLGVWGEFEDTEPPNIDVLAVSADATQVFHLDLVQLRAGPG